MIEAKIEWNNLDMTNRYDENFFFIDLANEDRKSRFRDMTDEAKKIKANYTYFLPVEFQEYDETNSSPRPINGSFFYPYQVGFFFETEKDFMLFKLASTQPLVRVE